MDDEFLGMCKGSVVTYFEVLSTYLLGGQSKLKKISMAAGPGAEIRTRDLYNLCRSVNHHTVTLS
jgi:hypothetical protein